MTTMISSVSRSAALLLLLLPAACSSEGAQETADARVEQQAVVTSRDMLVTARSSYSSSVYTLFGSSSSGLTSVSVVRTSANVAPSGYCFPSSATVIVNPTTYAALWSDVSRAGSVNTLTVVCNDSTLTGFSWVSQ